MNTWKPYNKTVLTNNIEVKTIDNKVHSIYNVVGGKILKFNGEEIISDDILFWREKKDWNRYNKLQKHYQLLNQYDFEKLDNLEFAIYDSFYQEEDKKKVEKLFKKLSKYINSAEKIIEKESKKYLS